MKSIQKIIKSAVLPVLFAATLPAHAQQASVPGTQGNLNTQKAAENFADAMQISSEMQLTGSAARLLELTNELQQVQLETKNEEAKTELIEARLKKADARRRQQESLFRAAPTTQPAASTNALPEVPGAKTGKTEPEQASAEEESKDKEKAFEHSPLPTVRLISGSGDKYRAIISKSNGAPETIYAGDKVGTWTVRSISTNGVVVVGGDKAKTVEHLSFAAN